MLHDRSYFYWATASMHLDWEIASKLEDYGSQLQMVIA